MPIVVDVDPRRLLIRMELSGTLTVDEMVVAVDEVIALDASRDCSLLSDHRSLVVPAATAQLHALVSHMIKRRADLGGKRWAIVVERPVSYGMMRMLGVLAEQVPVVVEVFKDPAAAERWLGLPSPDA